MYWGFADRCGRRPRGRNGFRRRCRRRHHLLHRKPQRYIWADTLQGDANVNVLYGHDGKDTLNGRGGADEMHGGRNNDTYYVDNASDKVFEEAGEARTRSIRASAMLWGPVSRSKPWRRPMPPVSAPINLTGNAFVQTITGNAGANIINGGGGADTMQGLGGDDMYYVDNAADA